MTDTGHLVRNGREVRKGTEPEALRLLRLPVGIAGSASAAEGGGAPQGRNLKPPTPVPPESRLGRKFRANFRPWVGGFGSFPDLAGRRAPSLNFGPCFPTGPGIGNRETPFQVPDSGRPGTQPADWTIMIRPRAGVAGVPGARRAGGFRPWRPGGARSRGPSGPGPLPACDQAHWQAEQAPAHRLRRGPWRRSDTPLNPERPGDCGARMPAGASAYTEPAALEPWCRMFLVSHAPCPERGNRPGR